MHTLQHRFDVELGYPVHFSTGCFDVSNPCLRDLVAARADYLPAKIAFIIDHGLLEGRPDLAAEIQGYCRHHEDVLKLMAPVQEVPGGERVKNEWRYILDILRIMHDAALCRHSYIVAIGGGAVLDAVGFGAAMAHRGVRLIRVPTTVLSQDDSGMGVKNGINAFGKKNYLGTFSPPFAVINDQSFLATLSDRDWRGGTTEAVKVALIRDPGLFEFLEQHAAVLVERDLAAMAKVIRQSAVLHLRHISTGGDPFEQGSSRPLDFGHWAAHKLEQVTNHRLGHGEAVGIGIALDSTYAYLAGFLAESAWRRIIHLLGALGVPVYDPAIEEHLSTPEHPDCVLGGLADFQEHLGGRLTIMLLKDIGHPFDVHEVRPELVVRSIEILKSLEAERVASAAKKAS